MWDLSSLTRDPTHNPCIRRRSLNHWLLGKSQAIHLATDFSNKMPLQGRSLPEEDGWEEGERVVRSCCKGFEEEMKTEEVLSERTGHTQAGAAVIRVRCSLSDAASWLSWSNRVKPLHWWEDTAVPREPSLLGLGSVRGLPCDSVLKNLPAMQETLDWEDPWVGKVPWRRACQPTPVFLAGEFHGQRSLVGYIQSMGSHRGGHEWSN